MSDSILRREVQSLEERLRRLEKELSSLRREASRYPSVDVAVLELYDDVTNGAGAPSLHKYFAKRAIRKEVPAVATIAGDLEMPEGFEFADADRTALALDVTATGSSNIITSFPAYRVGLRLGDAAAEPGRTEGGNEIFALIGGGGIPAPTEKYQVFTPIDDTLTPIWTTARFK